jgi:hypothetical protein
MRSPPFSGSDSGRQRTQRIRQQGFLLCHCNLWSQKKGLLVFAGQEVVPYPIEATLAHFLPYKRLTANLDLRIAASVTRA